MSSTLPYRPPTNGTTSSAASNIDRQTSFSSFPPSRSESSMSSRAARRLSPHPPPAPSSDGSSQISTVSPQSSFSDDFPASKERIRSPKVRSQYPAGSSENHVEYILVATFHENKGPVMENQYPGAISGDENMLAELMLPDQAHVRNQDWTIFFLHKDNTAEDAIEEDREEDSKGKKQRRNDSVKSELDVGAQVDERAPETATDKDETDPEGEDDEEGGEEKEEEEEEDEGGEGPPLIYVLNLVNTKSDATAKRGAIVRAMAICTRHSFLHIYKPLLLLALEEYFKSPHPDTLALLYDAVNSMDLSLMPRLSILERYILQSSDAKDLFIEKFEYLIQERMAKEMASSMAPSSPESPSKSATDLNQAAIHRHAIPRDTHEFETRVLYNGIPVPIKVPVAISPETVGDFSLIKLIQAFSIPHATSPQPFTLHSHLTTGGAYTHPIIVLVNALLTQKRVIFLGHNRPSGEVAEAVLAACGLASGGILRGFTRHAFPYTDLTKIDDLLKVPGFIAGVTNPAFAFHPEWWDLLCDLPAGRMKISNRIEPAPITEGQVYFQQQHPAYANGAGTGVANGTIDPTGDQGFIDDVLKSIASRYGEGVIRTKWKDWVVKFTRIAAAFEESVYGASALYIGGEEADAGAAGVSGHGYVWGDEATRQKELAGNVSRIEGWRNTRSYYSFKQVRIKLAPDSCHASYASVFLLAYISKDLAQLYSSRPISRLDLHHHHDRLRTQRLNHQDSAAIYLAFASTVRSYAEICQLLTVTPESHAGLFYISLGLFHPRPDVRMATVALLERVQEHEAGRHFWSQLGRFAKLAYFRAKREGEISSPIDDQTSARGVGIDERMRGATRVS
ncbi:MAG: hypothetical protein M1835_001970 [Candelina submexicana]|nr:MAG: hypothetical protein M1835_001970 [Candelina submexicana]